MGRTLYLHDTLKTSVMRDGPSVWIMREGSAGQRVPVNLVGRVVVIGNITLAADAITLFTECRVPVIFMNASHEEVAIAVPYKHGMAKFAEEQRIFLISPYTVNVFKKWACERQASVQRDVRQRLGRIVDFSAIPVAASMDYHELIRKLIPADLEQWFAVSGVVRSLFRSVGIECLLRANLDPHLGVLHRRENFGFALDLCDILEAEQDIQCLQFLLCKDAGSFLVPEDRAWIVNDQGLRDIIHRFENRREAVTAMTVKLIEEIMELMRELEQ